MKNDLFVVCRYHVNQHCKSCKQQTEVFLYCMHTAEFVQQYIRLVLMLAAKFSEKLGFLFCAQEWFTSVMETRILIRSDSIWYVNTSCGEKTVNCNGHFDKNKQLVLMY